MATLKRIMLGDRILSSGLPQKESQITDFFALRHQLTKREFEIVQHPKAGHTTEQIAQAMNLSYFTVETHRKNINAKLKISSKQEFYKFLESI